MVGIFNSFESSFVIFEFSEEMNFIITFFYNIITKLDGKRNLTDGEIQRNKRKMIYFFVL